MNDISMMAVPYRVGDAIGGQDWHCVPSSESWSYSPLEVEVNENTTADDIFAAFDAAIDAAPDGEDCKWGWIKQYRERVSGFALVPKNIVSMLETPRPCVGRDSDGDAIATFQVAFCVAHATRLLVA